MRALPDRRDGRLWALASCLRGLAPSSSASILRSPLFLKYVALFVAVVSVALVANAAFDVYFSYQEQKASLVRIQREQAQAAAGKIGQFIAEIQSQLGWTVQLPWSAGALEQRRFDALRLLRQVPAITELAEVDATGHEQLRVSRLAMDVVGSNIDDSKDPAFTRAVAHKVYYGPVYFRRQSEPYMTLALAGTRREAGVSIAQVNVKFIGDVLSGIKFSGHGRAYVADAAGRLIAHPDISLVLRNTDVSQLAQVRNARAQAAGEGGQDVEEATDIEGQRVLTASARVAPLGWFVFVETPLAEALAPLYGSIERTGLVLLGALALAFAAGMFLARRMVVPIQALRAGAARIGSGDLGERIAIKTGDEVEALADQFNDMAGRLQESYTDLEQKVEVRTHELSEALEQQTATADVLRVISSSPGDLKPVFDTMLENATRLCEAPFGTMLLRDGGVLRVVAARVPPGISSLLMPGSALVVADNTGHPLVRVLETKDVIHFADLRTESSYTSANPRVVAFVETAGARTGLCVPLMKDDECIGAFVTCRQEVRPFSDKQIELVKNFAAQAVIAIENARLLGELRESLEQQTAISEILRVISSSPSDVQPVLDAVATHAAGICEAQFVDIVTVDDGTLRFGASTGELARPPTAKTFPLDRSTVMGRSIVDRQTVHVADLQEAGGEFPLGREGALRYGHRTTLAVPLIREGRALGTIMVRRKEVRPFEQKHIALLQTFADQAALAIENARLFNAEQQRTRELTESLEQQTATSEVLRVISSSPGDLQLVFQSMLENAIHLCGASFGALTLREGDAFRGGALYNMPAAFSDRWFANDLIFRPGPLAPLSRAAATKDIVHIADLTQDAAYREHDPPVASLVDDADVRAILLVPMLKEGEMIGALSIYGHDVRPFTDKQIELVRNFAAQAVIAIENTRLLTELRARTDELGRSVGELRALGEVSQAVNSTLDLETVLSTIVAKAVQLSHTDAGAIYVYAEAAREFGLRATYGMDGELVETLKNARIGFDERNIARLLADREPVQVADLAGDASSDVDRIVVRAGYRSRLTAPLFRGDDIVGLLVVRRLTPGAFAQTTVDLIKTFAAQSAVAIQNARLFENVEARTRDLAHSLQDLRTAQDRLIQTEKLASLGQLTAGIAHEIKNPLNFVNNFSALSAELIDELQDILKDAPIKPEQRTEVAELSDMLRGNLDKVVQHGKRADSIVKNMLLHSRQGSGEHQPADINALVEESLNLAYHGARAEKQGFNITMEKALDPEAGTAELFPQEITRVLLNLITNGFYAATKRKAQTVGGDYEPTLKAATRNLGDRVEIRIRDNGTGIPPEVKEKMFNPFFTTKPAGEGTGLGLSLSHDIIVKQHSGSIEVDTRPGEFTEFRIVLPRVCATAGKPGGN